jgi:hypothetical protein
VSSHSILAASALRKTVVQPSKGATSSISVSPSGLVAASVNQFAEPDSKSKSTSSKSKTTPLSLGVTKVSSLSPRRRKTCATHEEEVIDKLKELEALMAVDRKNQMVIQFAARVVAEKTERLKAEKEKVIANLSDLRQALALHHARHASEIQDFTDKLVASSSSGSSRGSGNNITIDVPETDGGDDDVRERIEDHDNDDRRDDVHPGRNGAVPSSPQSSPCSPVSSEYSSADSSPYYSPRVPLSSSASASVSPSSQMESPLIGLTPSHIMYSMSANGNAIGSVSGAHDGEERPESVSPRDDLAHRLASRGAARTPYLPIVSHLQMDKSIPRPTYDTKEHDEADQCGANDGDLDAEQRRPAGTVLKAAESPIRITATSGEKILESPPLSGRSARGDDETPRRSDSGWGIQPGLLVVDGDDP